MMSVKKVFVVDDDTLYTYGIKRLLHKRDPESDVRTFENGEEALNSITRMYEQGQELPGVILLDLNMPKMNGWEFLRGFEELRSQSDKDVQVFVISSQAHRKDEEVYRVEWDQKVSEFIQKPVDAEAIINLMEQV